MLVERMWVANDLRNFQYLIACSQGGLGRHGAAPPRCSAAPLSDAGAGNCHNGGDPGLLYETFVNQLAKLPEGTRVYPGHEYMARNLAFTLHREPGNAEAAKALAG